MSEISAVAIATKQRYVYLLQKVRGNKTLSALELRELKGLEATMAKSPKPDETKTTKPAVVITKKAAAIKKTAKTAKKKTAGRKTKKTRRKRSPVSGRVVRHLAFECGSITEADAKLAEKGVKGELAGLMEQFGYLAEAWERGVFLRELQQLAMTAVTIPEAEASLEMGTGELKKLLDEDAEVADIWNRARLNVTIEIKQAIVKQAIEGKPSAIKQIEMLLRQEIGRPRADLTRLSIGQMVELTGKTRQTIHDWVVKHGLGRNADRTFDLKVFVQWLEEFAVKKMNGSAGRFVGAETDPLKVAKTERLQLELEKQKGNLLDRNQVIAGQMARQQTLVNTLDRKASDLAMLCQGQSAEAITKVLDGFFEDLRREQCQIPEQLQLPAAIAKKFRKLMDELRPEGEEGEVKLSKPA